MANYLAIVRLLLDGHSYLQVTVAQPCLSGWDKTSPLLQIHFRDRARTRNRTFVTPSTHITSAPTAVTALRPVAENGSMTQEPRPEAPKRRIITPAQKLQYLTGYEQAIQSNEGGTFLRSNGLYSSQIAEWRKLRDAGVLEGKQPGQKIGKLSREQTEIARLKRELADREQKLETTQTALDIMGKAHALLEQISKSAESDGSKRNKR